MKVGGNIVIGNLQETASYLQDTGVADAYTVSFLPAITGYTDGLRVIFKALNDNTGPATLEVDGYGPIPIVKEATQSLGIGDILAGEIIQVIHDGTHFQMIATPQVNQTPIFGTFRIDGGELSWTANLDYTVSQANYVILGAQYHADETNIILSAADPSFDRVDLVVANTSDNIVVLTGVASANPLEPPYDPATQIPLGRIDVLAGSTSPACALLNVVYRENAGTPTEWAAISSSGSLVVNSTNNPRTGILDIEGTAVPSATTLTFTPSSSFDISNVTQLVLYIRSKGSWGTTANGHRITVTFTTASGQVGIGVVIPPRGAFGFESSTVGTYQQVAIDRALFNIPNGSLITSMIFTIGGIDGTMGFYIDDISLEQNCIIPTPFFNNGLTKTGNQVQFGGNLVHNTTLNTLAFVQTFSGNVIQEYTYQFFENQVFKSGNGLVSWKSKGGDSPDPDFNNQVRLGINYTSSIYRATPSDLSGFMGDKIGYYLTVNGLAHASFGHYTDDANSKTGGVFIHTLDSSYTDMVTIFGKHPPTADGDISIQGGNTGFANYRIATFHDDKRITFWGYGDGSFDDSPDKALGVLADGRVITYDPLPATLYRFGFSGEDDLAASNRSFDLTNLYSFVLRDGVTNIDLLTIDPTSFSSQLLSSDGTAYSAVTLDGNVASAEFRNTASNGIIVTQLQGSGTSGIITLTTPGGIDFANYGVGTFLDTPIYALGVLADGSVIEYTPGGGSTMRFGFAGEDDTAAENRSFDISDTYTFAIYNSIVGGGTNLLYIDPVNFQSFLQATDGTSNSYFELDGNSSGSVGVQLQASDSLSSAGLFSNGLTNNTFISLSAFDNGSGYTVGFNADAVSGKTTVASATGAILSNYGTGTFLATPTFGIGVDASGNVVEYTPITSQARFGVSGEDDTAAEARSFDQTADATYILTISGISTGTENGQFQVSTTGSNGTAIFAQANNGTAIQAVGDTGISASANTGSGISATSNSGIGGFFSSNSATGVFAISTSGTGLVVSGGGNDAIAANLIKSSTSSAERVATFSRTTTGTAADGIGLYIELGLPTTVTDRTANRIQSVFIDATDATRTSELTITGINSSVLQNLLKLRGNGIVNISQGAPEYTDNADAISNGLVAGDIYRTGDDLKIVH